MESIMQLSRSIHWPIQDDIRLLCQMWLCQHEGSHFARIHIPGQHKEGISRRIDEFEDQLPTYIFNLGLATEESDDDQQLHFMLKALSTPDLRQRLLADIERQHDGETPDAATPPKEAEHMAQLSASFDSAQVSALARALDHVHRTTSISWSRQEDLHLICKLRHSVDSKPAFKQQDVHLLPKRTAGACQTRIRQLRSALPTQLQQLFLPPHGGSNHNVLPAMVHDALQDVQRVAASSASSQAYRSSLATLRGSLQTDRQQRELRAAIHKIETDQPQLLAAHPALLCNPALSPQRLDYEKPVRLPCHPNVTQRRPLPHQTLVQPVYGCGLEATAAIPPQWVFSLDATR